MMPFVDTVTALPAAPATPAAPPRSQRHWAALWRDAASLLLAVVVGCALGAAIAPGWAHWQQNQRNRFVAEQVAAALTEARQAALQSHHAVVWVQSKLNRDEAPCGDGSAWQIRYLHDAGTGHASQLGSGIINENLGVRLRSESGVIVFNADGTLLARAAHLDIDSAREGRRFRIVISADGQVALAGQDE